MADPNNPWGQTTDNPWPDDNVAWTDSKQQPQSQADGWGQSPADSDWGEPDQSDQAKQASQDAAWGKSADNPDAAWNTPADDRWDDPADSQQASQQDTSRNPETTGWGQAAADWNTPTGDDQWGNPPAPDNQWEEEDSSSQWGETAEQIMPAATPDNKPADERKHGPRKPVDRKKLIGIIIGGVLILILIVILCHGRNTGTTANSWQKEWTSLVQQADHMAATADQSNQQARNMITDIKTTANTRPNGFAQYVAQTARLEGDMSVLRSLEPQPAQTVGQTQTALTQALTPALTAVQQHAGAPSANPLKQLVSQWAAQTITSSNQTQAQQAITRIQQLTQQVDQNK